jgi:hypothetical protein
VAVQRELFSGPLSVVANRDPVECGIPSGCSIQHLRELPDLLLCSRQRFADVVLRNYPELVERIGQSVSRAVQIISQHQQSSAGYSWSAIVFGPLRTSTCHQSLLSSFEMQPLGAGRVLASDAVEALSLGFCNVQSMRNDMYLSGERMYPRAERALIHSDDTAYDSTIYDYRLVRFKVWIG